MRRTSSHSGSHCSVSSHTYGRWNSGTTRCCGRLNTSIGVRTFVAMGAPVGNHLPACEQCANAHPILTSDGRVAEAFRWTDPDDDHDPARPLTEDGIQITDGRADQRQRITADQLVSLVNDGEA
jgi:hypothetical protein